MSIIEELYSGIIKEVEQLYPHSEEYKQAERRADELRTEVWQELPKELKKRFGRYHGAQADCCRIGNRESFEQGFRTGARLMLEIFLESEENPCNKRQKEIQ